MSRMRRGGACNVAMIANFASDTGYAWWLMRHFWRLLAEVAERAGSDAYVAYPRISGEMGACRELRAVEVELNVPTNGMRGSFFAARFMRSRAVSVLYFTDRPFFSWAYLLYRLAGVKRIIVHDHTPGDRPPVTGLKGAIKALRNRVPLLTADCVFNVSELMRERSLRNARIPPEKCIVIQNGIPPVDCSQPARQQMRASLGLSADTVAVVATGRVHRYKRFDLIVRAAAALHQKGQHQNIVFLLVGDGPDREEVEKLIATNGLVQMVRLLGFRRDVHEILCAADIALHAALGEGFSLSIIEYMSAGLPVLVPDIPSVKQAVMHDRSGFVYPVDAHEEAAAYIHRLAIDADLRREMGRQGQALVRSRYSLEQCTAAFVSACRKNLAPLLKGAAGSAAA